MKGVLVISFDQVVVVLLFFCFFVFLFFAFLNLRFQLVPLPAFELLPVTEMHTSQYT